MLSTFASVLTLQAAARGRQCRLAQRRTLAAAVVLQAAARRRTLRRRFKRARHAARKLQASTRGAHVRRARRYELSDVTRCALSSRNRRPQLFALVYPFLAVSWHDTSFT
eukprot:6201915-Pleurochrysis_carterae.AAC.3